MKNFIFLLTILNLATFTSIQAQSATYQNGMQTFTRKYMAAYNAQDCAALKNMYTESAIRIDHGGKEISGNAEIASYFSEQFRSNNATLLLRQKGINWSDAEHAWVVDGTYKVYGTTYVYDMKIHRTGDYANTMVKDNGQWKIAKSVQIPVMD